jgi:isopentenyl-diphosphate delta-isomerase type 1
MNAPTMTFSQDTPEATGEELFDVVDANDIVIDVKPRAEVHRLKLPHRAIHVFVFNQAGQLYLQRRSLKKDTAPGKWVSSCSGHVDSGENYMVAAIRELGEEIGLYSPDAFEPILKTSPCAETGQEFVWLYRCLSEGPFELDPEEVLEGCWVSLSKLDKWIAAKPREFSWSFIFLWEKYKKQEMQKPL